VPEIDGLPSGIGTLHMLPEDEISLRVRPGQLSPLVTTDKKICLRDLGNAPDLLGLGVGPRHILDYSALN